MSLNKHTYTHARISKSGQVPDTAFNCQTATVCVCQYVLSESYFWIIYMHNKELHHTYTPDVCLCVCLCLAVCVCVLDGCGVCL